MLVYYHIKNTILHNKKQEKKINELQKNWFEYFAIPLGKQLCNKVTKWNDESDELITWKLGMVM